MNLFPEPSDLPVSAGREYAAGDRDSAAGRTARRTPLQDEAAPLAPILVKIFEPAAIVRQLRGIHGSTFLDKLGVENLDPPCIFIGASNRDPAAANVRPQRHGDAGSSRDRLTIRRQLERLWKCDADIHGPDDHALNNLSHEELLRSRRLMELLCDEQEGWRPALIATPDIVARLQELRQVAPHFGPAISIASNAAHMSMLTGLPLHVPPILLLGDPGIGKTYFSQKLAAALGTSFVALPMNLSTCFGRLAGLSTAWKGAAPGKIAQMLIGSSHASPMILLDEVDKAIHASAHDRPLDPLHSLWEPENARAFRDEYLDLDFDASGIISLATANSTNGMPNALLDRLIVLAVDPPTVEQRRLIAAQAYAAAVANLKTVIEPAPSDEVLDILAGATPRRSRRLIELALPAAIASKRQRINVADLAAAANLLDSAKTAEKEPIGFLRGRKL